MVIVQQHIISKICAILLAIAVLVPVVVKANHVLENHEHNICDNNDVLHFHEINLDCEFYKFKLNTQYVFTAQPVLFTLTHFIHKTPVQYHSFLSYNQHLAFALRAPPYLV